MSHFIVKAGPFQQAVRRLLREGFTLSWLHRTAQHRDVGFNKSNRLKYTCPECNLNAWAKPGVSLFCGNCNEPLRS